MVLLDDYRREPTAVRLIHILNVFPFAYEHLMMFVFTVSSFYNEVFWLLLVCMPSSVAVCMSFDMQWGTAGYSTSSSCNLFSKTVCRGFLLDNLTVWYDCLCSWLLIEGYPVSITKNNVMVENSSVTQAT